MTYYEAYSKSRSLGKLLTMVANDRAVAQDDSDKQICIMDAALTVIAEHYEYTKAHSYPFYPLIN